MTWKQIWVAGAALLGVIALWGCQSTTQDQAMATEGGEGSYAVGSRTVFIHDTSRPFDAVAGVNSGVRSLIAEIWYPANPKKVEGLKRATYGDYVFGDRQAHRRMMKETSFYHLTTDSVRDDVSQVDMQVALDTLFEQQRGSYLAAPVAEGGDPFPVIVMSHGDAGSRYNMQTVCEYLAAHGYIVIAPEHTGNTPFSQVGRDPALKADGGNQAFRQAMQEVLPLFDEKGVYGHDQPLGQTYVPDSKTLMTAEGILRFDAALLERVNDLRAAVEYLRSQNEHGPLQGKIDLQRLGLMGRSFGGATTLAGLALEQQFKAGMAVVAPYVPDVRALLPKELLKPAAVESAVLGSDGESVFSHLTKPTLLLLGAEDKIIIQAGQVIAQGFGLPSPTPENPHPMLRQLFEQSEAPVFWGMLADTNHASLAVSSPYWWPDLKPERFDRTLSPAQSYRLLQSRSAHQVQKEKARQFFDRFIKAGPPLLIDERGAVLKNNRFAEVGFDWDVRNF